MRFHIYSVLIGDVDWFVFGIYSFKYTIGNRNSVSEGKTVHKLGL